MLYWEIVRPADAKSNGYMGKINKIEGAQFVRFVGSLLDALRGLGSSGTPNEVFERIAENLKLADDVQNELLPSEEPRYRNQMAWSRFYLVREGLLDSSKRGVWSLTERGRSVTLAPNQAREIFLKWPAASASPSPGVFYNLTKLFKIFDSLLMFRLGT